MKQESWAHASIKSDRTGKMNHKEMIEALREGKTVQRGDVVLKLDENGKVNHHFTQEELHSIEWTVVEDAEEEEPADDLLGETEETETTEEEESTDSSDEDGAGEETEEVVVPAEKPVKAPRKPRTKKSDV